MLIANSGISNIYNPIGISGKLGGTKAELGVLEFIEELTQLKPRKAFHQMNYTTIEMDGKKTSNPEAVANAVNATLSSIKNFACQAEKIPVVLSVAGVLNPIKDSFKPANIRMEGYSEGDLINLDEFIKKRAEELGLDQERFQTILLNDGPMNLIADLEEKRDSLSLQPGDFIYHAVLGSGFGGAGSVLGSVNNKDELVSYKADEPGHDEMPYKDHFHAIEGESKSKFKSSYSSKTGIVEHYAAGGSSEEHGLMGTLKNIRELVENDEKKETLYEAISKLISFLKERFLAMYLFNRDDLEKSKLIKSEKLASNEEIFELAREYPGENGDLFAKVLTLFQAYRTGHALAYAVNKQEVNKPIKMLAINGGLQKGIESIPEAKKIQFDTLNYELKNKYNHPGIFEDDPARLVFVEHENDGATDLLKKIIRDPDSVDRVLELTNTAD